MGDDGNCGFRAVAHTIFDSQEHWYEIRNSLLTHLESFGKNDTNPYAVSAGTTFKKLKDSLEWSQHHIPAPMSKWFNDVWHGQLVTDLYNAFLVSAEATGGTMVLLRAPTGFTTVNAAL